MTIDATPAMTRFFSSTGSLVCSVAKYNACYRGGKFCQAGWYERRGNTFTLLGTKRAADARIAELSA